MGHVSDNMANATNIAVERMKQNRAAKEAAARDAEKRVQAGATPTSYNPYYPKI